MPYSTMTSLGASAGVPWMSRRNHLGIATLCGGVAFLVVAGVSQSVVLGLTFAIIGATLPSLYLRSRLTTRRKQRRDMWPDVVDLLASSVRAGMAIPEALTQVGLRGPAEIRIPFRAFAADYEASGKFGECVDRLRDELADPIADRLLEAVLLAREVGSADIGHVLRALSVFLRDEARIRGELESRQSWTVNGARTAVAAPWVLLLVLSLKPGAVAPYDSRAGVVVLLTGAALCAAAYLVMIRIGRLSDEPRVLR
jgi:tight adherence protein B